MPNKNLDRHFESPCDRKMVMIVLSFTTGEKPICVPYRPEPKSLEWLNCVESGKEAELHMLDSNSSAIELRDTMQRIRRER